MLDVLLVGAAVATFAGFVLWFAATMEYIISHLGCARRSAAESHAAGARRVP